MKKAMSLFLALMMAGSVLCQAREYTPFSDVPEDSRFYQEVKLCYESGIMNGKSTTTFDTQSPLSIAQLIVMTARLCNLQSGGDGTIPDLPDLSQTYLRFLGANDLLIRSFKFGDSLTYNGAGDGVFIQVSEKANDLSLPEKCTLAIGFDGYGELLRLQGTRESYTTIPGVMNQGLWGTGYRFHAPEGKDLLTTINLFSEEELKSLKDAWWFPAAFYLACQKQVNFSGGLLYRAKIGVPPEKAYDPLTDFNAPASRNLFAWLLAETAEGLNVIHRSVSIPDVDPETNEDAKSIEWLYQTGILSGVDSAGHFNGGGTLTRGQAAAMFARVLDADLRV